MRNNQECKICEALEPVNAAIAGCGGAPPLRAVARCRQEIPAIGALPQEKFVLDWLPFHWCKAECVRVVALTMEPSNPGANVEEKPVPSAYRPLRYALRVLLFVRDSEGFLITPIAKCSLEVRMAREAQGRRWELCSPFLLQETEALEKAGLLCPDFLMVTVGDRAHGFFASAPPLRQFLLRHLGKLTHYGAYRYGSFEVGDADKDAFARFREQHERRYTDFVAQEAHRGRPDLDQDMEILFKWNQQMESWRARIA